MMPFKKKRIAIAVFVKTPGLSPVKTRLAKTIGEKEAEKFYLMSVRKINEDLLSLKNEQNKYEINCYWAVAEEKHYLHGDIWNDFPLLHQPQLDLGGRISAIYNHLIVQGYDKVILMGADAPHFGSANYLNWCNETVSDDLVSIGPTKDGGFYCFIGKSKIDASVWTSVVYSSSETAKDLVLALKSKGINSQYLEEGFDVDEKADLSLLRQHIQEVKNSYMLPGDRKLLDFIDNL